MFAFVTVNNNNKIVKLNIEDILAIQQLYGIKNLRLTITTQPPPPLSTTTTEITTNKPEYIDLCTLQYVDTVLVLRHRIFVTYEGRLKSPCKNKNYLIFWVYVVEYPSSKLKEDCPKRLSSLGFPPNALIDTIVNTNRGQTYVIFNNNNMTQIDKCSVSVRSYQSLQAVFPGIPSAPTLTFRYMGGNLYFAKKQQFYKFNEFMRTVTEAGKFNINVLNVEYSRDGLLQQMQDILGRLIRSSNTY
ncbi:hypothetical protein ALC56_06680 [Trachymyrmex septentrionalis]|uniref:Uncharacterized protein n=1 Tax=Trachymyrmex septentrionalis TaxID=34720 RepID=A0A151JWP0_9HYME|nr:hypothetical protein ALC56_06680 [Trachymyrmex septentrionalis]